MNIPPPWAAALDTFAMAQRAAGRSPQTVYLRRAQLARLAAHLPTTDPWMVSYADLIGYLGSQDWQRETLRSARAAVRTFYAWGVRAGLIASSPADDLAPVKPSPPAPRPTQDRDYRRALERASDPRDVLALRLGAEAGLRRGELVQVNRRDLVQDLAGWSLVVHGKGGRERTVPLNESLAFSVRRAVEDSEWAFPGSVDGHLSPAYLARRLTRLLPPGVTTHSLRHRFASRAYEFRRDMFAVQTLLGHASPETTRRYVAVTDAALRETVTAAAGLPLRDVAA